MNDVKPNGGMVTCEAKLLELGEAARPWFTESPKRGCEGGVSGVELRRADKCVGSILSEDEIEEVEEEVIRSPP